MNKKVLWITETAIMLALLITLQWAGSLIPEQTIKQLITGSFVNCVLAVTALVSGMSSGITVATFSPICAFFLGIAPNFVTVVPIMLGNICFVALLRWLSNVTVKPVALGAAALTKFGVLYLLVVQVICGLAADALLGKKIGETVVLAPPMLKMLPGMFTWPQLITAVVGGAAALLIVPVLKKALHK